jgi:ABC-type glycerol-3-phosphate transport system substrate-binding protein
VPTSVGSQYKPCCSRIDLFKRYVGMDVQAVFPVAEEMGPGYSDWTWDAYVVAAEKCSKAGYPFGMPMGQTSDSVDWVGALFRSFNAVLVDSEGGITVRSDAVRAVLDYAKRIMQFFPQDVYSWDDASNNRALISGRSASIMNPPSAWAVAVRDNRPVGEQCWMHPPPAGVTGRFTPHVPFFWGVWKFAKNKLAAKELIEYLCQREQVEQLCNASAGYDIPPFASMLDFQVWAEVGPPKGTVFNYPLRTSHRAEASIAAYPAPPEIAVQIYHQATMTKMIAKVAQSGLSTDEAISWAERELEGFMR